MRFLVFSLVFVFSISFNSCARRVVVAQPSSVTIVKKLSKHYNVVKVRGKRYYYFNGNHYRKTRNGYLLVRI